jgi:hypothetical protein
VLLFALALLAAVFAWLLAWSSGLPLERFTKDPATVGG